MRLTKHAGHPKAHCCSGPIAPFPSLVLLTLEPAASFWHLGSPVVRFPLGSLRAWAWCLMVLMGPLASWLSDFEQGS